MTLKLFTSCLLLCALLTLTSFDHPMKLTSSLVEYDADKKVLNVECRVFIDDFTNILNRPKLDVNNLLSEDIAEIENFFYQFYRIEISGSQKSLDFVKSKVFEESNVLSLSFSVHDVSLDEGDDLQIENTLFFSAFGAMQSNHMTLRLPPFVTEEYHECIYSEHTVSYTF